MDRGLYVERSAMLYKASRRASLAFKHLFLPFRVEQEEAPQKQKPAKRLPTFIPPPPPSAQQPQTEENHYQSDASELDMSDCEEDSDDEESDESP